MKVFKLIPSLILIAGLNAIGAEKAADKSAQMDPKMQEMMKKYEAASKPGEPHKVLAGIAGNWKTVSQMWHSPDGKPETSKGSANLKMILGGRWLQQEFKGSAMGQPFQGIGMIGYDNVKQKYVTNWYDSMSTGTLTTEGEFDPTS
ncbi:MAG: DUF1579 domain-containing protein, partial [Bdellovibrionota bacterium]